VSLLEGDLVRVRLQIRGRVQGVGFRPFVYRLAHELGLTGWVRNDNRGVVLEIEGDPKAVCDFDRRLQREVRLPARIDELQTDDIPSEGTRDFTILPSSNSGSKETTLVADMAPCAECRRDFTDPSNRRHLYPFTNCTQCGPRFTIIRAVPYDRPNTTMVGFVQCPKCQREYDDPADRRFHAQPNACPTCGPQIRLILPNGDCVSTGQAALIATAEAILQGRIVAIEGIGGFQLMVDARSDAAVERLRACKNRWEKPLAVMVEDLEAAEALASVDPDEAALLVSPEAPIVLVRRRSQAALAASVAPSNPYVGLMLPSSPLHHLLFMLLHIPLVATSGNLSEEPICIDPVEAQRRLSPIADLLLVHDRPIERHADDSVAVVVGGEAQLFRRARGYAPLPIPLLSSSRTVLALGGHLKNAVALALGDRCFVSQHIGDLETVETRAALFRVIFDFLRLYETRPAMIAHDLHPDYASTQIAEELVARGAILEGTPLHAVQHHHAHLASCLVDAGTDEPVLGILWDGSGLGTDGTLWGGEFFFGNASRFERVACLQPFLLPGGDRAARSPRRIAAALLYQFLGAPALANREHAPIAASTEQELAVIRGQIDKRVLSPYTSSIGRLFDAVASLLGLYQDVTFEGQAAMALEFVADCNDQGAYPLALVERTLVSSDPRAAAAAKGPTGAVVLDGAGPARPGLSPRFYLDPTGLLEALLDEQARGVDRSLLAARFHGALVDAAVEVARRVGVGTVALSGGCFQNRLLLERCRRALTLQGHRVLTHHQVPPNDGGLALGQVAVARSTI
jgi:hydrogenase maturation protein HypF